MLGGSALERAFAQHARRRAAGAPVPAVLVGPEVTAAWTENAGDRGVVRSTALSAEEVARAYLDSSEVRPPLVAALLARVAAVRANGVPDAGGERTAFERAVWLDVTRDAFLAAGDHDAPILLGLAFADERVAMPLLALGACARVLGQDAPQLLLDLPAPSLDVAIRMAVELASAAPSIPLAVTTTSGAWHGWRTAPGREHAQAMVRPYVIQPAPAPPSAPSPDGDVATARAAVERAKQSTTKEDDDAARSVAERLLFDALEAAPASRGLFELNRCLDVKFGPRALEIDLACPSRRIAVEVDGYFHFRDLDAYRRDRRKDVVLQREGYLVMRFLADDVVNRLEEVLSDIRIMLEERRR